MPQGPGVRDDSGAYEGGEVPIFYDPMISKLITWGDTREHAIQRMRRALAEYQVRGIRTTIPFFQWILDDEDFKAARFDTGFIDRKLGKRVTAAACSTRCMKTWPRSPQRCTCSPSRQSTVWPRRPQADGATPAARKPCDDFRGRDWRQAPHRWHRSQGRHAARRFLRPHAHRRRATRQRIESSRCSSSSAMPRAPSLFIDAAFASSQSLAAVALAKAGGDFDVHLDGRTIPLQIRPAGAFGRQKKAGPGAQTTGPQRVISPMPGKVVRVLVKAGDEVKARQGLVVVEAMKMENELRAGRDGRVRDVAVAEGQSVDAGAVLLVVE